MMHRLRFNNTIMVGGWVGGTDTVRVIDVSAVALAAFSNNKNKHKPIHTKRERERIKVRCSEKRVRKSE